MKIVEMNDVVKRAIHENKDKHFKVKSVLMGGQTLLSIGPFTIRVKLNNNPSLKKNDTVIIHPETLEVVKI